MHFHNWSFAMGVVAMLAAQSPSTAEACGGFFCSPQGPVVQNAERIIFIDRGDGRTTAVVQIQYQGPAEQFSWIVPVPSAPEIGVSSGIIFQRLDLMTRPTFGVETRVEGQCDPIMGPPPSSGSDAGAFQAIDAGVADAGASGVSVVASGAVGPFDFVVLGTSGDPADPAAAIVQWLDDNSYDVTQVGPSLIADYVSAGMLVAAFRLRKDRDVGDIQPVTLTYRSSQPMIPIKLTAVAALPNMAVTTWIVGPSRAAPLNYRTLELNPARINWLGGGFNYFSLVNEAADDAGGQGFVTELAQSVASLPSLNLYTEADFWQSIRNEDWSNRLEALIDAVILRFGTWDGMPAAVAAAIPLPANVSTGDFLRCPSCFFDPQAQAFEPTAFLDAVEAAVIEPVRDVAALIDQGTYLTRMYTTLSPEEMTEDPEFAYNSALPDVTNTRVVERVVECEPGFTLNNAPYVIGVDGLMIEGRGSQWPVSPTDLAANLRIVQLAATGEGVVVVDNSAATQSRLDEIAEALKANDPTMPGNGTGGMNTGGDIGDASSSCRCVETSPSASYGFGLLAVLVGAGWIRRRQKIGERGI